MVHKKVSSSEVLVNFSKISSICSQWAVDSGELFPFTLHANSLALIVILVQYWWYRPFRKWNFCAWLLPVTADMFFQDFIKISVPFDPACYVTVETTPCCCLSGLAFIRQWCREVVPTVDNNLAQSLMRLLDCFLEPFQVVEGSPPPNPKVQYTWRGGGCWLGI